MQRIINGRSHAWLSTARGSTRYQRSLLGMSKYLTAKDLTGLLVRSLRGNSEQEEQPVPVRASSAFWEVGVSTGKL